MDKKFWENGKIPTWLGIIIVIVIGVAAIFLVIGVIHQNNGSQPKNNNNNNLTKIIQGQVFSYIGKVKKIEKGKIIFFAEARKNKLRKDTIMTAVISSKTKFDRVIVPKTPPKNVEEGSGKSIFTREEIKLSDIKVGDEVTVVSGENIAGKTEFPAKRVEIINVK